MRSRKRRMLDRRKTDKKERLSRRAKKLVKKERALLRQFVESTARVIVATKVALLVYDLVIKDKIKEPINGNISTNNC